MIYTDHKNLTFTRFSSDRVRRWCLFVEEYGLDLCYFPGERNQAADALSRLPFDDQCTAQAVEAELYAQTGALWDQDKVDCPIAYDLLERCQKAKILPHQRANPKKRYFGWTQLVVNRWDRIMVPPSLCAPILNWYHKMLGHPGVVRLEKTLLNHFAWPSLQEDVLRLCKTCELCQTQKKQRKHY